MSIANFQKSDYEAKVWVVNNAFNDRLNVDQAPPSAEADEIGIIDFSWYGASIWVPLFTPKVKRY